MTKDSALKQKAFQFILSLDPDLSNDELNNILYMANIIHLFEWYRPITDKVEDNSYTYIPETPNRMYKHVSSHNISASDRDALSHAYECGWYKEPCLTSIKFGKKIHE